MPSPCSKNSNVVADTELMGPSPSIASLSIVKARRPPCGLVIREWSLGAMSHAITEDADDRERSLFSVHHC